MPIGVLVGCFGGKIDGTGLPGGSLIYEGHLFALKRTPMGAPKGAASGAQIL